MRLARYLIAGVLALSGCSSTGTSLEELQERNAEQQRYLGKLQKHIKEQREVGKKRINEYLDFLDSIKKYPLEGERQLVQALVDQHNLPECGAGSFTFEREGQQIEVEYDVPTPLIPDKYSIRLDIKVKNLKKKKTGDYRDMLYQTLPFHKWGRDEGLDGIIEGGTMGMTHQEFGKYSKWAAEHLEKKKQKKKRKSAWF